MKKISLLFLLILMHCIVIGQEITGDWSGELEVQGTKLPLVFHITKTEGAYKTTIDSPMQGAKGIATGSTEINKDTLHITIPALAAKYLANFKDGLLIGTFTQGGLSLPLTLKQGKGDVMKRPQEPKGPFPYAIEEVKFKNPKANNITFAGTLTLPKAVKNPPVAIMVTGSGGQNRDEEILGHKPFLVIADYLTRNGIAVLRYDDRGIAASEGYIPEGFKENTTLDFALDAEAALDYLKTRNDVVDVKKIGFIGHSEGGLIAPIVASKRKDVAFCILLAGPGVNGKEILLTQNRRSAELSGTPTEILDINEQFSTKVFDLIIANGEDVKGKIKLLFDQIVIEQPTFAKDLTEKEINKQIKTLTADWMSTFLRIDPAVYLAKVKCPVLAINGEKDFQVLPDINLNGIEKALKKAGNKNYTIKKIPNQNHLFQNCDTGAFGEYAQIEETFAPETLELIGQWLNNKF